ncbi:hypothetical protein ACLOJK_004150 [Asimina triloba]
MHADCVMPYTLVMHMLLSLCCPWTAEIAAVFGEETLLLCRVTLNYCRVIMQWVRCHDREVPCSMRIPICLPVFSCYDLGEKDEGKTVDLLLALLDLGCHCRDLHFGANWANSSHLNFCFRSRDFSVRFES